MADSKYEKYVVREMIPPDPTVKWGLPELGIVEPYHFLNHAGPIKESNSMFEFMWVTQDSAFGVSDDKPPHKHDCAELFVFIGTNPDDVNEFGADIELWMGEGEETEQIKMNHPGLIYVPGGLLHLPIFFRNVKRPVLWIVAGLNIEDSLQKSIRYPTRGI